MPDRPVLVGGEVAEFSTSGALLLRRPHVADVNGYYRALGVDPYATKAELRRAFTARGGPTSARLTYVLKQLLQDDVRAAYDATPLGSIFFDDVIAEAVRNRVTQETADRRLAGDTLADADPEEVVEMAHLMGRAFSLIDRDSRRVEDGTRHQRWAWYEWKVTNVTYSLGLVTRWRDMLVAVAQDCGLAVRLAVGIFDWPPTPEEGKQVFVTPVGYRLVAFLHYAHEPTEHEAVEALHQLLDHTVALNATPHRRINK